MSAGPGCDPEGAAELGRQGGGIGVRWSAGRSRRARWSARPSRHRARPPGPVEPQSGTLSRCVPDRPGTSRAAARRTRDAFSFGLGMRKIASILSGIPAVGVERRADQHQPPDQRRGCCGHGRRLGSGGQARPAHRPARRPRRSPGLARGRTQRCPRVRPARTARAAGRRRSRPAAAARPAPPRTCARPARAPR